MKALRGPVLVTGTDTGVGKTIVTAAIAAAASAAGLSVAVVKPCQTGTATGEEQDAAAVARLASTAFTTTLARYAEPLAPTAAARVAGLPMIQLDSVIDAVQTLIATHDLVLVEGAGGVLVPMGIENWTVIDLAATLTAPAVVVARAGLGTLNHTGLTRLALSRSGIRDLVVIGAWPAEPELVHYTNLRDLPPLSGVLPEGAGGLSAPEFQERSQQWLSPDLHGSFDAAGFTVAHRR